LHRVKDFPASHPIPPASGLGVHEKLGGDTVGTADPDWPKGHPVPYGVMLGIKAAGRRRKGGRHSE